jgi:signal peptidase II
MPTATLLVSTLAVLCVDQGTKLLVLVTLQDPRGVSIGRVAFRPVINRCARSGGPRLLALWLVELVLLVLMVELIPAFDYPSAQIALGTALGGAAGNLLDLWCRNGVIDFIDVGFWPVFNLADAAIVLGAIGAAAALV